MNLWMALGGWLLIEIVVVAVLWKLAGAAPTIETNDDWND